MDLGAGTGTGDGTAARGRLADALRGPFPAFVVLYATLYGAYGTESPFLPSLLGERGLSAGEIGLVLAAGTLTRIAAGPVAGWLADRHDATRLVLGVAAAAAGGLSFLYLLGHGFWLLLAISMAHACAIAGLAPLADALALAAAARDGSFAYGWIRGAGSAAFILGTLASGALVARAGLDSIVVSSGVLFLAMALAALRLPCAEGARAEAGMPAGALRTLAAIPLYRRLVLVAALVIGSHAANDAFAVIRWREAGIAPGTVSLLWSEAVASEVVVFVLVGPWLLARLGPARAAMLAAAVGVLRWGVMAATASVPWLAATQLAHGLTFALLHLAAMRVIGARVPARLSATAQTLYGTFGLGLASAGLTLASGLLFARLGAGTFWVMAGLCLAAIPLAARLGPPAGHG